MHVINKSFASVCVLTWICAVMSSPAFATPQQVDNLTYGYKSFPIFQIPMLGLWHFGEGISPGKTMPPKLEMTSTANWSGYTAAWRIANGKLFLESISGRICRKGCQKRARFCPAKGFRLSQVGSRDKSICQWAN